MSNFGLVPGAWPSIRCKVLLQLKFLCLIPLKSRKSMSCPGGLSRQAPQGGCQRGYKSSPTLLSILRSTTLNTNTTPRPNSKPTNSSLIHISNHARFPRLHRSRPRSHCFCQPRLGDSHLPARPLQGRIVL